MDGRLNTQALLLLVLALAFATVLYWPGLTGGFIYDDFVFIVSNPAVKVSSLNLGDWIAAAGSFPADHQGRWLGMLSFAANHYLQGLDPWGYKLTNLVIHLLNGVLVFLVLRALLSLRALACPGALRNTQQDELIAVLIAATWLILPINLTAVLYIGQRLESLSNTVVLLGLWRYLLLRKRDWLGATTGLRLAGSIALFTGFGLLVKESAVLLPLYVACVEIAITGMKRSDGSRSRAMENAALLCLLAPLLIGLLWLSTWVGGERSYSRSFTVFERVLTQGRVLLSYVEWTLLPNLSELTLYHDDIVVSRGLTQPWTTLPSILAIGGSLLAAILARRRMPLLALGILWFCAGHALTSTLIPLMLAFEHRNYFPSIGLLLLLASLLSLETRWLQARTQAVLFAALYLFYAGTTHLRALEWSHPVRLAASEANKRPDSVDAQYAFARALVRAADGDPYSPLQDQAIKLLGEKRDLPGAGLLFDHALLILSTRRGGPVDPTLWPSMLETMQREAPRASDLSAVVAMYECMQAQQCPPDYALLRKVIEAALQHPSADADLYSIHALLVFRAFADLPAARRSFAEALRRRPDNPGIQFNRVLVLIEAGQWAEAQIALEQLEKLDKMGSVARYVDPLKLQLAAARRAAASARVNAAETARDQAVP